MAKKIKQLDTVEPRYNPKDYEVAQAKHILQQKQRVRNLMVIKYLEMVTRMAELGRQGYLQIRIDAENGLAIELWTASAECFVPYDFIDINGIKEGLKIICGYIERGDAVPFFSMVSRGGLNDEKA